MNQELENKSNELQNSAELNAAAHEVESTSNVTNLDVTVEPVIDNQVAELSEEEHEIATLEELPDFANLKKEELLQLAETAIAEKEINEAISILKAIKPTLEHIWQEEQAIALEKYMEEGGDKDSFEFKGDGSKDRFNNAFKVIKQKKEEARLRQEAEKLANLKQKEAILEEIKKLNDGEETAGSLNRLKELQADWKKIKHVPKENADELWERYRVLVEIFYDRLSINNELKDLDRSKNLDAKIELIAQVSHLTKEENSIKKILINVKKLQEDWRNIGPVAKEASDDIWNRFKAEVDKVFDYIKSKSAEVEAERTANLNAKNELLATAKELSNFKSIKIKEWMEKTTISNELMESWKKIGHVPMAAREQVWNEFKDARNTFYTNKNQFFKTLHTERNNNLKAKESLCEIAESIANQPIDWAKQTDELKKLQESWKKIGPAPDKVNDAIWKRFRSACDLFFEKKAERYASVKEEQEKNLALKNDLIQKLESLLTQELSNPFQDLKQIQNEWSAIGYVPNASKDAVHKKYTELLDKLYGKYKQLNREIRLEKDKESFEQLASSPNGNQKLQREEKILGERIKGMKKDIETWENNLGFFKSGNAKNPMAEQIIQKIEIAKKHIQGLEEKMKVLKDLKKQKPE